jgi:hypothetical protein
MNEQIIACELTDEQLEVVVGGHNRQPAQGNQIGFLEFFESFDDPFFPIDIHIDTNELRNKTGSRQRPVLA